MSRLLPGTLVGDRYRIDAPIGEGAMGVVYRAEHLGLQRPVALKVLRPDMPSEVVARFEREAVAAAVEHPNIAQARDCGRLEDGSLFLVLEYVAGRSLRSELATGPLAPSRAFSIVRQIAVAIGAAHAEGIVHRDLKPDNVMLVERDGNPDFVKVLDFGIAKIETPEQGAQPLTRVGAIFGTPDYMAPEQALGETVDLRADLYSLGIVLYELLTGQAPYQGGTTTILRQHICAPLPTLPPELSNALHPRVAEIFERLLAKLPGERYASAAELILAIDDVQAPGASLSPFATETKGRQGASVLAAFVLGASALAGFAILGAVAYRMVQPVPIVSAPFTERAGALTEAPDASEPSEPSDASPAPHASASSPPHATVSRPPGRKKKVHHRWLPPGMVYLPPPNQWFK